MSKYRIRKLNKDNWVIEQYQAGGEVIHSGKRAGQLSAPGWAIEGYFTQLKFAAARLVDVAIGEPGMEVTGREILERIDVAERVAVAAAMEAARAEAL